MKELDDKFFLIYIKGYNLAVFLVACVFLSSNSLRSTSFLVYLPWFG